ncbi:MAG: hypothetical protein C5B46_01295 [Proteobacteria bacterium]|nr:MAG: hypothetical protein C5B46_01295 [Pseudomonadota bacterium]
MNELQLADAIRWRLPYRYQLTMMVLSVVGSAIDLSGLATPGIHAWTKKPIGQGKLQPVFKVVG